jgi:hypothetical protein
LPGQLERTLVCGRAGSGSRRSDQDPHPQPAASADR